MFDWVIIEMTRIELTMRPRISMSKNGITYPPNQPPHNTILANDQLPCNAAYNIETPPSRINSLPQKLSATHTTHLQLSFPAPACQWHKSIVFCFVTVNY